MSVGIIPRTAGLPPDTAPGAYGSSLGAFQTWCGDRIGRSFAGDAGFADFSVQDYPLFWRLFLEWSGLPLEGSADPVVTDASFIEKARFFPGLRLNYAECLLAGADGRPGDEPALISCRPGGRAETVSRSELRRRVRHAAAALRAAGLRPGDRVAAVLRNDDTAIVACLAVAALGASFSSASPEMAPEAVLSRFSGLRPSLLLGNGGETDRDTAPERLRGVAEALRPALGLVIVDGEPPAHIDPSIPLRRLGTPVDVDATEEAWERFGFNQPLFVMFSSGTTGEPKRIVHGSGGTLLEHVKEHRLHCDVRPGDRILFHTTCAWMMWNWQMSALASGATLVLWDGPVEGPDTLWRLVARHRVTVFGTSPPFLRLCAERGYSPGRLLDLQALRSVLSTGSVLQDHQFDWVTEHAKSVPVQSISGGTDIIGCFLLGHPHLAVRRGEAQSRSLGLDVRALPLPGAAPGAPGELVCANPFPSCPLGFLDDTDGRLFHKAYFAENPGLWTHGDLVTVSEAGGWRLHGRSDGVINVNGIRIGPAEIYAALSGVPEVEEAMAVEQTLPCGRSRIALIVVLREDAVLDARLGLRIRREIGSRATAAHVPAVVAEVSALPTTHSGKQSERAAADIVSGRAVKNREALRNPWVLDELAAHPALAASPPRPSPAAEQEPAAGGEAGDNERMAAAWSRAMGLEGIQADDDFFHLGGDSLLAIPLLLEVEAEFGRLLPMSVLFQARTVSQLAAAVYSDASGSGCLAMAAPGSGRPVFAVHGMSGTVVEQRDFLAALSAETGRPVMALQSAALDMGVVPHRHVREMAAHYVAAIRTEQPDGPYAICGYSFGGLVAVEMARILEADGQGIELLGVLDTGFHPGNLSRAEWLRYRARRIGVYARAMHGMDGAGRLRYLAAEAANVLNSTRIALGLAPARRSGGHDRPDRPLPPPLDGIRAGCELAYADYRVSPLATPVTLFRATQRDPRNYDPSPIWRRVSAALEIVEVPGTHHGMVSGDAALALAGLLAPRLDPEGSQALSF